MATKLEVDRTHWISLLEKIALKPASEANAEWKWLMAELKLPNEYFFVVSEVIAQGRWRKAKNPKGYLKASAKREYLKANLVSNNLVVLESSSFDKLLDVQAYTAESPATLQGEDGTWRSTGERFYDEDGELLPNLRERLLAHLPKKLTKVHKPSKRILATTEKINALLDDTHIHVGPRLRPDWEKWAKAANFSRWDKKVLEYRLADTSREKAMLEQSNSLDKKALQAAWRKFDRNGFDRLQAAAGKTLST